MTADDTSREALIESLRGPLANVLCNASNFPRRAQPHILGADMGPLTDATAEAVVDAVVMPLAQERDAAIKRAEAAEAAHKALTEAVLHVLGSGYGDPMDAWYDLRAILDEHGAGR